MDGCCVEKVFCELLSTLMGPFFSFLFFSFLFFVFVLSSMQSTLQSTLIRWRQTQHFGTFLL
ncbi:hypothetical protein QBC42DRAFT_295071, partial [Cladorrhinum samala]